MTKCLNCEAEVKQTEGRRPRKFCDNKGKCRLAYWNKNQPKKGRYVLKTTFDKVKLENAAIQMELAKYKIERKGEASGIRVDIKTIENESINDNGLSEQIAKIEETLKMPPKYLPASKRKELESQLSALKYQLKIN